MSTDVEERQRQRFDASTEPVRMLGLRFSETLAREFQELARRNGRSMRAELERAMRAHIAHNQD